MCRVLGLIQFNRFGLARHRKVASWIHCCSLRSWRRRSCCCLVCAPALSISLPAFHWALQVVLYRFGIINSSFLCVMSRLLCHYFNATNKWRDLTMVNPDRETKMGWLAGWLTERRARDFISSRKCARSSSLVLSCDQHLPAFYLYLDPSICVLCVYIVVSPVGIESADCQRQPETALRALKLRPESSLHCSLALTCSLAALRRQPASQPPLQASISGQLGSVPFGFHLTR